MTGSLGKLHNPHVDVKAKIADQAAETGFLVDSGHVEQPDSRFKVQYIFSRTQHYKCKKKLNEIISNNIYKNEDTIINKYLSRSNRI